MTNKTTPSLEALRERLGKTLDAHRVEAQAARHKKGYRTARENLHDLDRATLSGSE